MEFFWVAIPLPSSRFCLITERTAVTLWFCLVFPGSGGCWLQPFCHDPPFFYPGLFSGLFGPARRHRLFRRCDLNGWSVNDEFFQAGDIINVTWISFRDVDVYIYILWCWDTRFHFLFVYIFHRLNLWFDLREPEVPEEVKVQKYTVDGRNNPVSDGR